MGSEFGGGGVQFTGFVFVVVVVVVVVVLQEDLASKGLEAVFLPPRGHPWCWQASLGIQAELCPTFSSRIFKFMHLFGSHFSCYFSCLQWKLSFLGQGFD